MVVAMEEIISQTRASITNIVGKSFGNLYPVMTNFTGI